MKRLATTILLCAVMSVKAQTVVTKHIDPPPPPPPPAEQTVMPQSCGITAAAAYKYVKPYAVWVQVIAIRGTKEWGITYFGHAGVVFQYQVGGQVFFYDATGTRGLGTDKQDVESLKAAFQKKLSSDSEVRVIEFLTK